MHNFSLFLVMAALESHALHAQLENFRILWWYSLVGTTILYYWDVFADLYVIWMYYKAEEWISASIISVILSLQIIRNLNIFKKQNDKDLGLRWAELIMRINHLHLRLAWK